MADLALDIEVVAPEWDDLSEWEREYLLSRARTDEDREQVPERLALQLGLGQVVAVGVWSIDQERGKALVVGRDGSEADVLVEMWQLLEQTRALRLVTYDGRAFDGPVLHVRSAQLGVASAVDLVPYRFDLARHCDLADVLGFWGATRTKYSLRWWCSRFGIPSPKEDMDGSQVAAAWLACEYDRIADYVLADCRATGELYRRLRSFLHLWKGGPAPTARRPQPQPARPAPSEQQQGLDLPGAA